MRKLSTMTLATIGGIAVAAPLAMLAGPAIGGIIGAKVLGLSGAAATSAGLAVIGGGSLAAGGLGIAGGMLALTVTGSALGGALGAYLCNQYIADIEGFDIIQMRRGKTPAIITVSGFLTQGNDPEPTWGQIIPRALSDHAWYHVQWESKRLTSLGAMVAQSAGKAALAKCLADIAAKASKRAPKNLAAPLALVDIIGCDRCVM